jgi:multimeric flavodoxin WrbA
VTCWKRKETKGEQIMIMGDYLEQIKLLGICGSPRKNGNSAFMLNIALEAAREYSPHHLDTKYYSISGKTFHACDACNQCHDRLGHCRQTDDDFAELRDLWIEADAIIYAVPIYHMSVPGALKNFIDRVGNSVVEDFYSIPMKVIGTLVQGTGLFTGQEAVMTFMNNHALLTGNLPLAGQYTGGYIGVGGWTRESEKMNAMEKMYEEGEADTHLTVSAIQSMGVRVVQLTQIIKSGGRVCAKMLDEDGLYEPFLRRIENLER